MKIGIVGYQGSGKSTFFQWLTGEAPDPAQAHATQAAMAVVYDPRLEAMREIYQPKKMTYASLELVDTPGLSRTHEGSASRLAMIREAGCLAVVVSAFDGSDPAADLANFEDDLLIADLAIVAGRVERLEESIKKPRPEREQWTHELHLLKPLHQSLDEGKPLRELDLSEEQRRAIKSFQLFTEKPRCLIVNLGDDELDSRKYDALAPPGVPVFAFSLSLQLELSQMDDAERDEFCQEMGVSVFQRDQLLRDLTHASQQQLFFTAGEKEVRSWLLPIGGTAVDAAGGIHTDLAKGFIRAEVMRSEDLIRLGSEREVKANNLMREEPKAYVVQEGDVLLIRHN